VSRKPTIAITGIGDSGPYQRVDDRSLFELVVESSRRAIADAGLKPSDVDGILGGSGGPTDELAAAIGITNRRFSASPNASAGGASVGGAQLAQLAIDAGLARHVLNPYGIKMSGANNAYSFHARDPHKADLEMPVGFYGQPVYFALWAQAYKAKYGLKEETLGEIAVACRKWAQLTPGSQATVDLSMDDYLASPMISTPLKVRDCCLNTDGSASYVMSSLDDARNMRNKPIVVAGIALSAMPVTLGEVFTQNEDLLETAARKSAALAYAQAGISSKDLDFAEIYDCFTASFLIQMEDLGICGHGEGADFLKGGTMAPGGSFPMNTHGGHLSNGYVPGANHVVEAVRQLRGERGAAQVTNAEIGLVAGLAGNEHATMILTVDR